MSIWWQNKKVKRSRKNKKNYLSWGRLLCRICSANYKIMQILRVQQISKLQNINKINGMVASWVVACTTMDNIKSGAQVSFMVIQKFSDYVHDVAYNIPLLYILFVKWESYIYCFSQRDSIPERESAWKQQTKSDMNEWMNEWIMNKYGYDIKN